MLRGLVALATVAALIAPAAAAAQDLKLAEYACYGSGGRILIGMGFKVLSGRRYTDLDNGSPGRFTIDPESVLRFMDGHLDGLIGRVSANGVATVGPTTCQPG